MSNAGREAYEEMNERLAKLGAPRLVTQLAVDQKKLYAIFERRAQSRIRRMLKRAQRRGLSPRECDRRSAQIYASLRPMGLATER